MAAGIGGAIDASETAQEQSGGSAGAHNISCDHDQFSVAMEYFIKLGYLASTENSVMAGSSLAPTRTLEVSCQCCATLLRVLPPCVSPSDRPAEDDALEAAGRTMTRHTDGDRTLARENFP